MNFNPFPLLQTERLSLRQVEITDVDEIFFMRSDPRVMKYIDKAPLKSKTEALEFIHKILGYEKDNEVVTWAITLHENPKLIGTICYWHILIEHFRAEVGYALHPEHQGKGIMQEALGAVIDYGFKVMKLHSVEANVNPNNIVSIKLLERNNFIREAYYKENYYFDGKFLDTAIYSLLAPKR